MLLLLFLFILVVYLIPVYSKPVVLPNFLSPDECTHLIKRGDRRDDDPVVTNIIARCLKHTDRPVRNCEDLQVLRFKPGDSDPPHQDTSPAHVNKRMFTFMFALNDGYTGGETVFPNIKREYKLRAGDALFFNTLDNYEMVTSQSLHGGKPVKSGEKWICNLWVHKHPYI